MIEAMDGALGADVSDLDVRRVDAADIEAIRAALLEYHVLALRSQRLDPAALSAFAAKLGEREVYPFAEALPDHPYGGTASVILCGAGPECHACGLPCPGSILARRGLSTLWAGLVRTDEASEG